jgi:hypothetical protein
LQRLIDAMRDAIAARESFPGGAKALADRSFEALRQVAPESAEVRASRLPACDLLAEALAAARAGPPSIVRVADAFAEIEATSKFSIDVGMLALSSALARGNEDDLHQADGTGYLGPGRSPGYAVVNLGARYQLLPRVQLFVQINNLFDRQYYSAAQLSPTGFTSDGNFIARPLPPVSGEFPLVHATFYAPGAPLGAWGGIRVKF